MPKRDTHKVNQDTYNRIGDIYARKNFEAMNMIPQMDEFLSLIPDGGSIIDLGCGPGHDTKYMADKGYQLEGVDYSESMINIAKKRVLGVNFVQQDIREYPIPEKKYDGIWCNSVLLHFPDQEKKEMLHKIYGGLKEGGILHVSFSEGEGKRLLDREAEGISDRRLFYDILENDVRDILSSEGLEIISFKREIYTIVFIGFLCRR